MLFIFKWSKIFLDHESSSTEVFEIEFYVIHYQCYFKVYIIIA